MDNLFTHIENAAHSGAFGDNDLPRPSEAECAAGNYKVGRASFHGLPVAIEQPRGTYRTGKDANGKCWVNRMAAHYGYISGTKGNDGDAVDCFIGFYPQSERVFVINQNIGGRFDEHKVMLGFPDEDSARRAYLDSYDRGWNGLASIVPCSISQLKWWLKRGDTSHPLRDLPPEGLETMTRKVQWNNDAQPLGSTLDQILYQIRCADAGEGLLMDAVTPEEITEDSDGILTFDALVSPYARLERKMELLRGIMERAGDKVKPVAMQITEPFKQRGVAHVAVIFELSDGQTVSIYFHNPDGSPGKMAPTDEVISWKWLLNKKDITIVVAPERGSDLNVREVARRIMTLAEKNSPAFQRVNSKRAERMQAIQGLKDEIAGLEVELTKAQRELEVARVEAERAAAEAARTGVFFHSGLKIYPVTLNVGGDVKSMWAVQTLNNAEREANGERQLGGDPVSETIDGAKRLAEGEVASAKQLEEYRAAMAAMEAERAAAEAARKEANQGKTLSEIKAQKYLDAPVVDGETGERMTRAEWVKRRIEAGDALDTWLENKIKDKSRREWDRMDNQEQAAHEAKVREGGQVSKYRIGEYTVTKTEYDYANYLLGKKTAQQEPAVSANPERAKAVQYLQGIVSGTTDPLTVDFDNLEALHASYGSDPEVAALFEKAADVVANAALAATA